jgi:hypothetical protein
MLVNIFTNAGTGVHDGVWPVTGYASTYVDIDIGTAGLSGTDSDRMEWTHGPCHNIDVYNFKTEPLTDVTSDRGKGLQFESQCTEYVPGVGSTGAQRYAEQLNVNGYIAMGMVNSAANWQHIKNSSIKNFNTSSTGVESKHGMRLTDCSELDVWDGNCSGFGAEGIWLEGGQDCRFRRITSMNNGQQIGSKSGLRYDANNGGVKTYLGGEVTDCVLSDNQVVKTQRYGVTIEDGEGVLVDGNFLAENDGGGQPRFTGCAAEDNDVGTNIV